MLAIACRNSGLSAKRSLVQCAANGRSEHKLAKLLHRSERRLRSTPRHKDGGGLCFLEGFSEDHFVIAVGPKVADSRLFFVAILSVELARQCEVVSARRVYDQDALPLVL